MVDWSVCGMEDGVLGESVKDTRMGNVVFLRCL